MAGLKDPPTEARLSFLHETALLPFVDAVGSTHRCAGNYRLLSGGGSVPIPPPMAPAGPTREKQQNPVETEESEPQRHRDTEETQSHPPTREPRRHQDTENLRRPPTHPDRPQITQMGPHSFALNGEVSAVRRRPGTAVSGIQSENTLSCWMPDTAACAQKERRPRLFSS